MSSQPNPPQRPLLATLTTDDTKNLASENGDEHKDLSLQKKSIFGHNTHFSLLVIAIIIMLIWPWIFFGVVWQLNGIQMNAHVAKVVTNNPHSTNFFVTLISNIISLIISILFSIAIIRYAQKWVIEVTGKNREITVFHVSLLSAFRHQSVPSWGTSDIRSLAGRTRWLLVLLLFVFIGTFTFIPSSASSLISPIPFNNTVPLTGTELDFASNTADCVEFFNATRISESCDWKTFKGLRYTTCLGENQLVDVLESGRSNILSLLSNNSESLAFSQLGGRDGLHFLGPLRGVLPIGPNGVPAFDTLAASPLSNANSRAAMKSYNYTLDLQGLVSDVKCAYDPTHTPVGFFRVDGSDFVYQYNGTCDPGEDDVLAAASQTFIARNAKNTLGFWACGKPSPDGVQQYSLYLRGRQGYGTAIGNITCTASPIQPAIFPVTYQSQSGFFSSQNRTMTFTNTSSELIQRAIKGLADVIFQSQNADSNLVAESVITFGVKSFGLPPYVQDDHYLRLYEAMFQGILEYEAAYTRLVYSTASDPAPPTSCIRTVSGFARYEVTGWFVTSANIGFLIPMTLVNLAALILALLAMFTGQKVLHEFDPTDPKTLVFASGQPTDTAGERVPHWNVPVTFNENVGKFKEEVLGDVTSQLTG